MILKKMDWCKHGENFFSWELTLQLFGVNCGVTFNLLFIYAMSS